MALVKREAPSSVRYRAVADIGACSCSTTRRLHTLKEKDLAKAATAMTAATQARISQ